MDRRWLLCLAAGGLAACAEAGTDADGGPGNPDGTAGDADAARIDAAPQVDAAPPPDAPPPDADTGCGDGTIEAPETCDDGNPAGGDGCSAACAIEAYYRCEGEPSTCAPISILYAPSQADDPTYRSAIAAITGGTVDYLDATASTPALTTLEAYDCVYTWANLAYADPAAFGDTLADYVDGGGNVVLGVFTTYTTGNALDGRIMTTGYSPVTSPTGTNHFSTSNYIGDGTTFIHSGVTTYTCDFRDDLVLQGTGVQDGSYVDGVIAHAYRPDFKVVYSNGSGDVVLECSGQWPLVVANSCAAGHMALAP